MSDTRDINKEVRSFFKTLSWKKILTFLLFVLLATIFWLMQIWRQDFETTLRIPVKYVNVPDSIIFEKDLIDDIEVKVKDDGAAILRYFFTRRNDSLIIDVRNQIKGSKENVIQGATYEQLIHTKLFFSSTLVSYFPSKLTYTYDVLHQKRLPVIYDGYVNLAPGYLLDGDLLISPDSVMVYGSRAALDTLKYVLTKDDTLENITSTKELKVSMKDIKGIKYIPNQISLTIPVDEFMQKEVEIPVVCVNLPSNLNIKFFPSSVKIPLFVGLKRSNAIKKEDFKVIVNYDDLKDLKDPSIPVRIAASPDYVQTKPPIPSDVEFVLEQK